MKRIISLVVSIGMLFSIAACSKKAALTWQEQYDLGVRYLSEGNYQEAIIAFTAAIEIEPKQAELYIYLADAYIGMDDYDKAREVIMQGLSICEDENGLIILSNYLYELDNNADISRLLRIGDQGNLVAYDEVNFLGYAVPNLDYDIAKNLTTQAGYTVTEFDEEYAQHFTGYRYEPGPGPSIMVSQPKENDMKLFDWRYSHRLEDIEYTPEKIGLRDIATLDSLADVLLKVGFTTASDIAEAANSAVEKVRGVQYSNFEEMRNYIDSFQKRASYNSEQGFFELSLHWEQREYYEITGACLLIDLDGDNNYHYSLQFDFEEDHLVVLYGGGLVF